MYAKADIYATANVTLLAAHTIQSVHLHNVKSDLLQLLELLQQYKLSNCL